MAPSPLRAALSLLAVLAVLSPRNAAALVDPGDVPPDQRVNLERLPSYTDPQFVNLARGAQGDKKRVSAVQWTQTYFNEAMHDPKQVPAAAEFALKDVMNVGANVAKVLDFVQEYQKTLADAKVVAQTDPPRAKKMVAAAIQTVQVKVKPVSAALPMLEPASTAGVAHPNPAPAIAGQTGPAPVPGAEVKKVAAPAAPMSAPAHAAARVVDLGAIVTKAATAAHEKIEGTGDVPNGTPGNSIPAGGAISNGPPWSPPTIGEVLGNNNPNSPADAMTGARQRYRSGDLAGGMADATRAIALGGGAEALVLRGGMQLDQKNYALAYQDASQALQADPSNKEALTVAHFSKGRVDGAGGGPAAGASFGGRPSEAGGFSGADRVSASALLNAPLPLLKSGDLRRETGSALRLNDLDGAMSYVNRGLSQDPNNPALLNMRASIYARRHDYDKAAEDAKAGLALAPKNAALLRTLAYAQVRGRHYKDALASSNELIALNPEDAYAYALRGHAYGSLGDRDAMMADLNRAAALDPRFQATAAQMAEQVQLPSDKDILFLFPGEDGPMAAKAPKSAAPPAGRSRLFGLLVGASVLGGLLLALGLLQTVLSPLKDKVSSVFTRVTGASSAAVVAVDTPRPASVNGLLAGLIRGQYEISRQIGQGGMGTVFEGTDRSLGRRVAIKKMRDELRVNPAERARFVIEAKTVAALHHPNIVDIYAIAEEGQDVFLVFEYVDGKTVHELIQSSGRLSIADAARVVRASADALGYAHSRGVIHRDMKPSNVMIDAAGRVKVMDFGIARMAKDSLTRYSLTNTVVGTPPYMAPEQEQGQVRRESDVYALAVCAYEMLTGKLPFIGIGAGMLMNKINMSFVPPSRATAGLPAALDEVFEKAFQAGPDQRYRTPNEFANALEAALPASVRA
jgi:tetratricopeptide (TPR) repeat protein